MSWGGSGPGAKRSSRGGKLEHRFGRHRTTWESVAGQAEVTAGKRFGSGHRATISSGRTWIRIGVFFRTWPRKNGWAKITRGHDRVLEKEKIIGMGEAKTKQDIIEGKNASEDSGAQSRMSRFQRACFVVSCGVWHRFLECWYLLGCKALVGRTLSG